MTTTSPDWLAAATENPAAKSANSAARENFAISGAEEPKKIWYNIDRSSKGTNT